MSNFGIEASRSLATLQTGKAAFTAFSGNGGPFYAVTSSGAAILWKVELTTSKV
jgi:hypothetical protein